MPKGHPNKRYTPEFKIKVVETMHKEGLSYREAGRQFEITDHNAVANGNASTSKKERKVSELKDEDENQQVVQQS